MNEIIGSGRRRAVDSAGRWAAACLLLLVIAVTTVALLTTHELGETTSDAVSGVTAADAYQDARYDAERASTAYDDYLLHPRSSSLLTLRAATGRLNATIDLLANGIAPGADVRPLRAEAKAFEHAAEASTKLIASGHARQAFALDQALADPAKSVLTTDLGRLEEAAHAQSLQQLRHTQQNGAQLATIAPIVLAATILIGSLLILVLRRERRHIELVARTDALTGTPNRLALAEHAQATMSPEQARNGKPALLLLDLDRFKEVNDSLGHHVGDRLLVEVARRLSRSVKSRDMVARLGGDEFAVLLPDTDAELGRAVATRLRGKLRAPFVIEGATVEIDVSIGIAAPPHDGTDLTTLMRCADIAMYAAKEAGGGVMVYSEEQSERTLAKIQLVNEIRRGLDQDEFVLHYQPKVALDDGRVYGVEALVRWQHPDNGLVGPGEFLSAVEDTELIDRITSVVLEKALGQARTWIDMGTDVPVAVNVPTRTLLDPNFPTEIVVQLTRAGVTPDSLVLEITECSAMQDTDRAIEVLTTLRDLGIRISVDDYGTGYASMSYLRDLPVHELKIDRSFITNMSNHEQSATLAKSIIELGHNLGLAVVAEGVEDADVEQLLREAGCDMAQGYYFSRPIGGVEMTAWLRRRARDEVASGAVGGGAAKASLRTSAA